MINTAAQGSNSVNVEKSTINFKEYIVQWSHGPVVWGGTFCPGESWGAGSNPGGATSRVFLFVCLFFFSRFFFVSLIVFLPFCLCPFILTTDPFYAWFSFTCNRAPQGTSPGICNFFLPWRSIPHPGYAVRDNSPPPSSWSTSYTFIGNSFLIRTQGTRTLY